MSRNLLLIGAGGAVGPWLARAVLDSGWTVIGISRRPTADYGTGYRHLLADARNLSTYAAALESCDAIIYNAAYIPENFSDPREAGLCLRVNAETPLAILDMLAGQPRPFVYISSAQGYQSMDQPVNEDAAVFPSGHAAYYLASKLLGDLYAEHHRLMHHVPSAVLRLGSIYGPSMRRGMIAHFIEQAAAAHPIVLKNGGRHRADLTYLGDVGAAAVAVLQREAQGIFNIGSGCTTSALDAALQICAASDRSDALLQVEAPQEPVTGFAALDVSRACREIGFVPTLPSVGLPLTVRQWG